MCGSRRPYHLNVLISGQPVCASATRDRNGKLQVYLLSIVAHEALQDFFGILTELREDAKVAFTTMWRKMYVMPLA